MDRTIIYNINPINPKGLVNKLQNHLKLSHQIMIENDILIQIQAATLKNLENQMGQLATEICSRTEGALPSDTESPRNFGKEHCEVLALQSGKILEPKEVVVENGPIEKEESQPIVEVPTPEKLDVEKSDEICLLRKHKQKQEPRFKKFLDVLKQLHINIPLVEVIEQMPNYVKFKKDILPKKKRLREYETVALMEECNVFLQNKLPLKLKDLRSFTILCNIRQSYCGNALCDHGASINLMPKSIFNLLGIGEVRPTTVTLQLADCSLAYLERPFLATRRMLIDMQKGELTMRVQDDQVTFNVLKAMKFPNPMEECSLMVELETLVSMEWDSNLEEDLLENTLGSEPLEDEKGNKNRALMEANPRSYVQPLQFELLKLENIGWTIADVQGIRPSFYMHNIILEEGERGRIDGKMRLNPIIKEVVQKEIFGIQPNSCRTEDQHKNTFTCPYDTFSFRRMPFSLCNAPTIFQPYMMAIFTNMVENFVEVLMDDFSIFGNTYDVCLSNLAKVLKRCEETM
ncbi:reverse transcriptase [Gossypium australe]|uniref:Reverse transcriptase n=1 Tax=Gossypium australe TaxID=47621 RepID=A0A5B6UYK3_9ROSI|nr:reverse transcriptase [Gossypium australe]